MQSSAKSANKAERDRWDSFRHVGCIVTRLFHQSYAEYDVHHLVEGGRRLGHRYTIPLSPWFHRGIPPEFMTARQAELELGPSFALNKKAFIERFGTERQLLDEVNEMIAKRKAA